jgi:hypothetical protein
MSLVDKIKLLFVAKKPVTEIVGELKQIKTGYKTVSFWVTLVGSLVSLGATVSGFLPATYALIITTVLTAGYNILRGIQNAGVDGNTPITQSTRFWMGLLGIVANALTSLQTGGVNPQWLLSANAFIAAIMSAAQNIGATQPDPNAPKP